MVTVNPNSRIGLSQFNSKPCEGAEDITVDIRFDVDADQVFDLTNIQGQGRWSGVETLYIDNSLSASPIFIEFDVTRQTLTVPPNSCWLMPILCANPPKFKMSSAGGLIIRMNILNYFFPPCVWSPTSPPGGGSSGGLTGVTPTDFSGASPVTIPANANRKWLLINNPIASGASSFITFAGGGAMELTIGGTYETGPAVPLGAVVITNAGGPIVAYEGV